MKKRQHFEKQLEHFISTLHSFYQGLVDHCHCFKSNLVSGSIYFCSPNMLNSMQEIMESGMNGLDFRLFKGYIR